jgi:hypothetical protein
MKYIIVSLEYHINGTELYVATVLEPQLLRGLYFQI